MVRGRRSHLSFTWLRNVVSQPGRLSPRSSQYMRNASTRPAPNSSSIPSARIRFSTRSLGPVQSCTVCFFGFAGAVFLARALLVFKYLGSIWVIPDMVSGGG